MQSSSFGSKLYALGRVYGSRALLVVACLLAGSSVGGAQIDYRPARPPATGAADRAWFRDGAPISFAGDLYYPSGPTVFFNGDSMVPTGDYDGITLYADTTVAPYSVLLVPVTDRILQPYLPRPSTETASAMRLPHYREGVGEQQPGEEQYPANEEDWQRTYRGPWREPGPFHLETVRKPEGNAGIWLDFEGHRWQQVGEATRLDPARLVGVGEYAGFPVYADPREAYIIYLPTWGSLVAPFRRVQR